MTTHRKEIIRKRMAEMGITIKDMVNETGVSMTTVYRFINGSRFSSILDQWCWDRLEMDTSVHTRHWQVKAGIREVLS